MEPILSRPQYVNKIWCLTSLQNPIAVKKAVICSGVHFLCKLENYSCEHFLNLNLTAMLVWLENRDLL